jgi:LuxR family maltose regulon positive regulatory protein
VETSLLSTKLNIPPARPKMVARPRLTEQLQAGLHYNLILISAPAGFGKTALLSDWARQNQPRIRTAWVSLDEGDNDPVRFWDYFIAALQKLQPACGEKSLKLLHSPQPPLIEPLLTALINDLAGILGDFMVVLDDYHLIESQKIYDGIIYLLDHLPSQMHLVIASRVDPPLPLARFRGKEMMLEIRTDDLRFNLDEVIKLLSELTIPELSSEDIAALYERTEGWVVGLKMAALSMSGQKDIPGFIAAFTGSQRYVMDYLMEEVMQKQTLEIRNFLMKTSVLERLSGPLCDAVTERKDGRDILLNLERGHLFIVPLDEARQWYRYEHLFADLLRHQCETVYAKEQVAHLHCKASKWYEDNNLPDDAIHHALVARDWETAMRLTYNRCEELRKRGEFSTLLGWLRVIPEGILREHHRLYSHYASFLTSFSQFDAAEAILNYLKSTALDDAALQGEVAFSLSNIARLKGDIKRMAVMAEKALSLLPPDSIAMRARATWVIGMTHYIKGLFHEAEKWMTDAYEMAQQARDKYLAASALNTLGATAHWRGKLENSVEILKKALKVAEQTDMMSSSQSFMCKVLYELNNLEAASEYARLSVKATEIGQQGEPTIMALYHQARIYLARGDVAGAISLMESTKKVINHPTVSKLTHARHAANNVIFAIQLHDVEAATKWGKHLAEYADLYPESQYVPARLLIAQGKKEEAAEYLRDLHERLVQVDAHGLAIGVRVCQALAAETEEAAREFLTDALIKGEPEGYIRTFVDEGKLLKPMLEKALAKRITPEYTRKLINIIETEERQKLKKQKKEGAPSTYDSILTEREFEVLRLMAEGLSNQQIADRLIISLGTAKNHVHNILEKLDAEGRTEAVARARELKLI